MYQWRLRNLDRNCGLSSRKFMAAKVATNFHSDLTTLLQRHAWRAFKNFDWNGKNVLYNCRSYFTRLQSGLISLQQLSFTQNFLTYTDFMIIINSYIGRSIKKVLLVGFYGEMIFRFRPLFKFVQVSDFVLF